MVESLFRSFLHIKIIVSLVVAATVRESKMEAMGLWNPRQRMKCTMRLGESIYSGCAQGRCLVAEGLAYTPC